MDMVVGGNGEAEGKWKGQFEGNRPSFGCIGETSSEEDAKWNGEIKLKLDQSAAQQTFEHTRTNSATDRFERTVNQD